MFACCIHFHGGWLWKSNVKRRKSVLTLLVEIERVRGFSQEVTLERVRWPCKWKCEKRKSVGRRSIYRKYVSWSRLQKRGTKLKYGRSFKHWPRGSPGQWVPETECLRASVIFVSGTSGITSILNYRSVSPILLFLVLNKTNILLQTVSLQEIFQENLILSTNCFSVWKKKKLFFLQDDSRQIKF